MMKRFSKCLIALLLIISEPFSMAQDLVSNSSVTGVCYAGKKVKRIYIPPPKGFDRIPGSKGRGSITVFYYGFPDNAKTAMSYAVSILESMLPVDAKITIEAFWQQISGGGVLGNSSITSFAGGWGINALEPYAFYPVSLAEKIFGESLNEDSEADIELIINSSVNWYLGTDGNTPVYKYDLVTVILHEICHGIGFYDSMNTDGEIGWYGAASIPMIYDTFIENLTNKRLTDTLLFENYSEALFEELTGGQLYFDGPLLHNYTSGTRARLYAPSSWDPGSSISHLDEIRTLPENSLMTPFIDLGEAIHDPGKLTMSIFGDMGWINTRIKHTTLKDTEEYLTEIEISSSIESDTLFNRDKIGLVYSFDSFLTSDTLYLLSPSSDDVFTGNLDIPAYNIRLDYYFFVEDCFLRLYRSPSLAEERPHTIYIGTDTVKPEIIHTAAEYFFEKIDSIRLEATVTDNLGIDTVYIEYKVNDRPPVYAGLAPDTNDIYKTVINARYESLSGGDSILYRIIAIDKATSENIRIMPENGYYTVPVETLLAVLTGYSTDFDNAYEEFLTRGFEITKPVYFNSKGLHTNHPYESPEKNDTSLEFSAILRHPVIFDETGMVITFRQLVLVEPGEEGSVFGSPYFYDYAIVEGSRDFGKTWFSLADGYDCRFDSSWETAYNSLISDMNSTYTGKESMMLNHTIYPRISGKVIPGDSLLVRFRLFSDPYANGWGWAIDDFKINPLINRTEKIISPPLRIYPNPGNGLITVDGEGLEGGQPVQFSVYNSSGICIINKQSLNDTNMKINLSGYPSGIYFIVVYQNDITNTIKYSLIR